MTFWRQSYLGSEAQQGAPADKFALRANLRLSAGVGPRMFYVEWNERTVSGLAKIRGCVRLLTEVAPDGTVKRELGFDAAAKEVHRAPTQNSRGLFDLVPVDTNGLKSTIGAQEFESLWSRQ